MRTYTIEFFYSSEVHDNDLLRTLHQGGIDIEATYSVDVDRRVARVESITGIGDQGPFDLLPICRAFSADEAIRKACEHDYVGRVVKVMFDNYPHLATSDQMTAEQKSEILKLK